LLVLTDQASELEWSSRRNPDSGLVGLGHIVLLKRHIKLGRFSGSPAVSSVKVTSDSVYGAEPA
jgi:hypothetical protein